MLDKILAWENGEMTEEEEIDFFQGLVDNGMAWTLQGMYGRRAMELINAGLIHQKGVKHAQKANVGTR